MTSTRGDRTGRPVRRAGSGLDGLRRAATAAASRPPTRTVLSRPLWPCPRRTSPGRTPSAVAGSFELDRVTGSHHIYAHPDLAVNLNLQDVGGDAKPYQVRQFLRLLERYDLIPEDLA